MLIEFRVENHRSLRDEQALTLEAGRVDGDPNVPRQVPGHNEPLLPAAVLYGANASGKSNVLKALAFMRDAVQQSHRVWEPEGGVPRTHFAWEKKTSDVSVFEATFIVNTAKYQYGFAADSEMVTEEWMYVWPNNHKQVWFERNRDQFTFGKHMVGHNKAIQGLTRTNALFLSTAVQHGHDRLFFPYSFFLKLVPVGLFGHGPSLSGTHSDAVRYGDPETLSRIVGLLRAADTGIVDIRVDESEPVEVNGRSYRLDQFSLKHQVKDERPWLELGEESEGTKALFRMAPSIFRTLDSGGILLVDELESSLHPLLGSVIVKLFNNPKTNPNNAQIIFTTHDTNLLGTTLGEPPLRRDQIWFTEKDKDGGTRLYPLTDYKPRKAENLERGYLQGRYGAIPFLGDIEWITAEK
jgi:AAA15 family ATPase/GTPase